MLNLKILALGIAVLGVSLGEGILVANIAKSAARQPEMYSKLQTLMIMGVAFIEGTFFVLLHQHSSLVKPNKESIKRRRGRVGNICKSNSAILWY